MQWRAPWTVAHSSSNSKQIFQGITECCRRSKALWLIFVLLSFEHEYLLAFSLFAPNLPFFFLQLPPYYLFKLDSQFPYRIGTYACYFWFFSEISPTQAHDHHRLLPKFRALNKFCLRPSLFLLRDGMPCLHHARHRHIHFAYLIAWGADYRILACRSYWFLSGNFGRSAFSNR